MRIIDLLNKIANGEEIPHFIVDDIEYYMGAKGYLRECMGDDVEWYIDKTWLNQEVQIIEENKKIEKLYTTYTIDKNDSESVRRGEINLNFRNIREKIDEIIEKLNEMENK